MNNLSLDFLVFREADSKHIRFYDRTVQAFFAAYWAMKHSSPDDLKLLKTWILDKKNEPLPGFDEFWRFAAEMPGALVDRDKWHEMFRPCYATPAELRKTNAKDKEIQWYRKMICFSCERMEERFPETVKNWRGDRLGELLQEFRDSFQRCPRDPQEGNKPFMMGSTPELDNERYGDETYREVTVGPFWMADFPVTNKLFRKFVPTHDSDEEFNNDEQPVVEVTYWDAKAFALWINEVTINGRTLRVVLPSEDQWEYACRAGEKRYRKFSVGDGVTLTHTHANFELKVGHTTVKGAFPEANAWLLFDMHGNVWEWCDSRYGASARVLRGGGWDDGAGDCRSAFRYWREPDYRFRNRGFRLAAVPRFVGAKPSKAG